MPIVKCNAGRSDPGEIVEYVINPLKVLAYGQQGFLTSDPQKMVQQMRETMRIHKKEKGRKYYHVIVAFNPDDQVTASAATAYASKYAMMMFQNHEVVWAYQDHGAGPHIHFVVSACDQETGRKLDVSNKIYRDWKDYAQELATEYGLTPLDWREATKKKREQERLSGAPVFETFAERGRKNRGKATLKDQLRSIVDHAVANAKNMDEFRAELAKNGVSLTRCTANTISYKWKERRAYRGDSLGDDYTAVAIRSRLEYNQKQTGIDSKIRNFKARANNQHILTDEERKKIYAFGQEIGMNREALSLLMDHASYADRRSKQLAWDEWESTKKEFWERYRKSQTEISEQITELYRIRRVYKEAEWMMHPYNQKASMWGVLYALVLQLALGKSLAEIEREIEAYKASRERLRKEMMNIKSASRETICAMKADDFSVQEYMLAVSHMHDVADEIAYSALNIPLERQYVLNDRYEMVLKKDYIKQRSICLEER